MSEELSRRLNIEIDIPSHMTDDEGNPNPEFYEPMFKMLGKTIGGVVINRIENLEVVELDTPH